jgi:hypothetical protein
MPKTTPSESLLALITGPERAAAIVGDLVELSASRGRLWFWTAYTRTLVALTWRIVLALFVAEAGREFMFNLANLYFHVTPAAWRTTQAPHLLNSMGPPLACIMSTLWFVVPFAAVRYGLRDRFVRLTFAVAAGTTVAFLFIPYASLLLATATLTLAAAAFLSNTWRKPLEVLAWTAGAGFLTIAAADALRLRYHPMGQAELAIARYAQMFAFQGSLLVLAFVCSRLHRLLLDQPQEPSAA